MKKVILTLLVLSVSTLLGEVVTAQGRTPREQAERRDRYDDPDDRYRDRRDHSRMRHHHRHTLNRHRPSCAPPPAYRHGYVRRGRVQAHCRVCHAHARYHRQAMRHARHASWCRR